MATVLAQGCAVDDTESSPEHLGETSSNLTVPLVGPGSEPGGLFAPGGRYTQRVDIPVGGRCSIQTVLGSIQDTVMWVRDESGTLLGFNDDSGGTLASRVDLVLSPGPHHLTAEIGGFDDLYAGTWTLTAQCTEPVFFWENFFGTGDTSQCNALAHGEQSAYIGDWTAPVRIDTDGRAGGCSQQFSITDPLGLVSGLDIQVNFFSTDGGTGQCQNPGNRQIVPTQSSSPSYTNAYTIDTDNRGGGCNQVFTLTGRSDVVLDVELVGDDGGTSGGQCPTVPTQQTAALGSTAAFVLDTDSRGGACLERFRLRHP